MYSFVFPCQRAWLVKIPDMTVYSRLVCFIGLLFCAAATAGAQSIEAGTTIDYDTARNERRMNAVPAQGPIGPETS